MVPKIKTLEVKPLISKAGMPNPTNKITRINGMDLKTSTYAVAKNLIGTRDGDLDVLIKAILNAITPTKVDAMMVKKILVRNPKSTLGSTSTPYAQSKKVSLRVLKPGESTTTALNDPKTMKLEIPATY